MGGVARKRTKPKVHSVLYIQCGEKECAPIDKSTFDVPKYPYREPGVGRKMGSFQTNPFPLEILVERGWNNRLQNEASVDFMTELAKVIEWPGKVYRAWKQGEYGYTTLVTMVLPP